MFDDLEEREVEIGTSNVPVLNSKVYFRWLAWDPDRKLNPQYEGIPSNDKTGIIVGHFHEEGTCARHTGPDECAKNPNWCSPRCEGGVIFDGTPESQYHSADSKWQVQSLDPLSISPSIFMNPDKGGCGLHGFITDGRWRDA